MVYIQLLRCLAANEEKKKHDELFLDVLCMCLDNDDNDNNNDENSA